MTRFGLTKKILISTSGFALAIGCGPSAFAQDQADGAKNDNVIIVTANKREQDIQDVSLSIQAFDAESLDAAGITDVSRLELLVSGVNYAFSGNDAKFNVRGANSSNTLNDNSSIVGAYVDGVYKPRAAQQTRAFYDVERVEFLKGPQGTLYGRNTFAGALNLITKKPVLGEYEAGIEVGYERFGLFKAEGYVNIPLGDNFALRHAGYVNKGGAYINNIAGPDIGEQDDKGFRISALWEPSSNFNLIARAQYSREDGREAGLFGYNFVCRNVTASGHTDALGSKRDCAVPTRGSGPEKLFGANSGQPNTGPYTISQDYIDDVDLEETVFSLEANLDLGAVAIKSITSYTDFKNYIPFDFDFSPSPHNIGGFDETIESFTQELQFNTDFNGPFNLTAGAYYSHDEQFFSFSAYNQTQRDDTVRVAIPVLDNAGNAVLDAAGNPVVLAPRSATPRTGLNRNFNGFFGSSRWIDIDTIGLYAQGEFEVSDTVRLIGGVRYSSEKKDLTGGGSTSIANGPITVNPAFGAGAAPIVLPQSRNVFLFNRTAAGAKTVKRTFKNWDYKAGVEFDVGPDAMLYATTATGFLSGAVNNDGTATDQQDSQVYEIGLKSLLMNGDLTFNLAAHYTKYSDLLTQFQVIDPQTGIAQTFTRNGGTIKAYGAELEAMYRPDDQLTLGFNASYLKSEYGTLRQKSPYQLHNGTTNLLVDLNGKQTIFSPEFTASIFGSYRIDMGDMGTLTPGVQFYYSDGFNTSNLLAIDPSTRQGNYTKTDLRLTWNSPDENYAIEAFVENIEDEAVLSRSNNNGDDIVQTSYLYPRNYGLRFKAHF